MGVQFNIMNPVSYLKATINELKQVTWPSRESTIKLTLIVLGISVFVGAYVGGLDLLFTNLLTFIIK
ncbi:MAG: Preprotein translocase, SecE subunit [Candidatus Amesbacteria bacterium GW2011_GWC1_47_15]|uniref:Protein translocase subunit SecE n=4 Tax=Candidatus Amesiibacteriota TaxID=1752730 RepID=A0A0G1UCE5_9BACT|nr:MAG: Preprotein translocase, SecE subunit [Candidatus Amesbacteria bacterium GW2011_GWC1_47_15]KKU97426.1 MAG: Preprotein translocase, SecE subunit [Candidatus Amesbacteria bacterium GW2011_GWB1_48_13]